MQERQEPRKAKEIILGFIKGFSLLLTYEVIEEFIEEAIAWSISFVLAKAISFIIVVLLTQIVKVSTKTITKALIIVIKPAVKRLTYKQGNDKINKIKNISNRRKEKMDNQKFLDLMKKAKEQPAVVNAVVEVAENVAKKSPNKFVAMLGRLIAFLRRNIKTNTATITNLLSSLGSGGAVGGSLYVFGVAIPQWSYFVIGACVSIIMFILAEMGIVAEGLETQEQYDKRKAIEKQEKEIKALEKKANDEKAKALKVACIEAKKLEAIQKAERLKAQEQEKILAQELKKQEEKAEQEKTLAKLHKYQDDVAKGYKGSLANWLAEHKE